jgi:gliding motility-associated-like protein
MTLRIPYILFTLSLVCSVFWANAQNKSNRGKEFWLGYSFGSNFFSNGLSDPVNAQELTLYISTEQQTANVTVTINNTSWVQSLTIPANTADASIIIPKSGLNDARILSDGLSSKAVRIVSDVPVAVYAHQYSSMYSAATMLMPVDTWGLTYYSVNYYQTQAMSNPPYLLSNVSTNHQNWFSWFYAVAAEDNTRILVTPSDTCRNGWLPGQTYTVNLNKGEIYTVFGKGNLVPGSSYVTDTINSSKDLSGSKVVSVAGSDGKCHPVALFSGTGGMRMCSRDGGEAVQQQIFPLQAWGTRYLTHHTVSNFSGDINETFRNYYRVCVKDPTTIVKRNGVPLAGLKKNFFYELLDSTGGDFIEADKPILVSQYTPNRAQCWMNITPAQTAIGDPEMFYLSPIEQGQKSVIFYTSSRNLISKSYVNIIIPTPGISSLLLDGAPVPASKIKIHPNNPAFSVAIPDISTTMDMQHTITSDSAFTATVYGLGAYESYGYNIGCNINNLNVSAEIKNVFSTTGKPDTVTCPKTPFRIFASIGYRLSNIHWKFSQAAGLTPNADSVIANPVPVDSPLVNGRRYYTYTVQQDLTFANSGTYKIPFGYTASEIDACSNTETDTLTVVVKPGPVANFSFTSPACLRDTVFFTSTSNPNGFTINNYLWNFDDATTQNILHAKKKFAAPGSQTVRYRIYSDNGCAGDTSKIITINPDPTAVIGVNTPACTSDSVQISDTSIIASGSVNNWQYFFGDGNTLTRNNGAPFKYAYTNPGTYTIKLITTSDMGCKSDTGYRTVTVFAKPLAKFGYDRNICINDSIRITDTSSITAGVITSWEYDFGDGNRLVRNNPSPFHHQYTNAGSFVVKLITVSDMSCKSDTFRRTVFVSNKPVATHTAGFTPCVDSPVILKSSYVYGSTPPVTYHWFFGDGTSRTITSSDTAVYRYTMPSTNIVTRHFVSVGAGCVSDTFTLIPFSIYASPVAGFTATSDSFCFDRPIIFNSTTGTGTIGEWRWSWGDGFQLSTTPPPITHTYSAPGTYNPVLTVRSTIANGGCISAPFSLPLTVYPRARVNAGPDLYIQPGQSIPINASVTGTGNFNLSWSNAATLSNGSIATPVATPSVTTTYVLTASEQASKCSASDAMTVFTISNLFIPNSFTPNGDGKHDTWNIPGMALYPDGRVTIFNRYGEKVYDASGYLNRPWDGIYKGQPVANGSYVYFIQLNNDKKEVLKGFIMVIR